jgi:predicted lipid-binding transport protein (Tim44 family)
MKKILLTVFIALLGVSFVALDAQARRLGGGGTSGLQRQMPARPTPTSPPAQQAPAATPAPAGATTPGAAPRRSWMGPIAGLAAGLGLAALASHLGMGAEFGNLLMIMLLAVAAVAAIRFVTRRLGPAAPTPVDAAGTKELQFAGEGAPPAGSVTSPAPGGAASLSTPGLAPALLAAGPTLPSGFDSAGFERIAKLIFIRMQAANDRADLEDLRQFATPEMFAVFRLDLQDRRSAPQQTDVVQLDAQILDFAQEDARQVVSVRFHGLIREERDGAAAPFDEVWHLVKPTDGSRDWAIAGIAQTA